MRATTVTEETRTEPLREDCPTPKRVCFVCTGNTCRSPMAAAVANALSAKTLESYPESVRAGLTPPVEAFSAGLFANEGEPIAPFASLALSDAGILPLPGHDYRTHTAHTLREDEAETYDLLVGMTPLHAMELLTRFPQLAGKITCMPETVPDPYGGDREVYRKTLERIGAGVKTLLFPERREGRQNGKPD